ncbi:MAG: alpha-amylase family glycosyl hydrolase [Desulfobacterales bacterium]|nr:alpha-amylase family glycosyl hydrolase [Desulfobacterales bacterium]
MDAMQRIKELLIEIYGPATGVEAWGRIAPLIENAPRQAGRGKGFFSEKDVVLITYGDSIRREGQAPLQTLHGFAREYLQGVISAVHFLPFFPWSSDDGFSVKDFMAIDPQLGDWDDVARFSRDFDLMFDYVVNHVSAQSQWFRDYRAGKPGFADLAIEMDPALDLSMVTRPRALPLLTEFKKDTGEPVHVWTTFSDDQIDLNYRSLDVLSKMLEALLLYVAKGARIVRMDAIAYLWKEIGTTCIHLPQTHAMVKLFRAVFDVVAPDAIIITETNVPHAENISYFGNGRDEAQMVYNFTLPPMLFHAFVTGDTTELSNWARGLTLASPDTTFFNFTASHDGIGVRPLEGILPPEAVDKTLADAVKANGGQISYKNNPDGSQSPYELNITYVDAMRVPGSEDDPRHPARFLASQSIQYALPGVPATYVHSLLGSRNWYAGLEQTGRARTINREKLDIDTLTADLKNPDSFRARVFGPYTRMIRTRTQQPAFHPNADFEILDLGPRAFGIKRSATAQTLWAVTNITPQPVGIDLSAGGAAGKMNDLISGTTVDAASFELAPYQFIWLTN